MSVYIIDTSPRSSNAEFVLHSEAAADKRVGPRIAQLCGVSYEQYLTANFKRKWLIPYWLGHRDALRSGWPYGEAKQRAVAIIKRLKDDDTLILLGRNVSRAFYPHWMRYDFRPVWFENYRLCLTEKGPFRRLIHANVYTTPYPCATNAWYNNSKNKKQAEYFWQTVHQNVSDYSF